MKKLARDIQEVEGLEDLYDKDKVAKGKKSKKDRGANRNVSGERDSSNESFWKLTRQFNTIKNKIKI